MGQVTTVRKIKTHKSVVWAHDGLIDLEVCRGTTQALNVDTPFLGVEVESLKSALLAKKLDLIDVLVTTIVSCSGVSFRVLVAHGRSEGVKDGAGCDVLGGDEEDRLSLALDLLLHDLGNGWIGLDERFLHELSGVSCCRGLKADMAHEHLCGIVEGHKCPPCVFH